MRELKARANIARREDVAVGRLQRIVDLHAGLVVERDPRRSQVECFDMGDPPDAHQDPVGQHGLLGTVPAQVHGVLPIARDHAGHFGAEVDSTPSRRSTASSTADGGGVLAGQDARRAIEERDLAAKPLKGLGHLTADGPRAEDAQAIRALCQREERLIRQRLRLGEPRDAGAARARPWR